MVPQIKARISASWSSCSGLMPKLIGWYSPLCGVPVDVVAPANPFDVPMMRMVALLPVHWALAVQPPLLPVMVMVPALPGHDVDAVKVPFEPAMLIVPELPVQLAVLLQLPLLPVTLMVPALPVQVCGLPDAPDLRSSNNDISDAACQGRRLKKLSLISDDGFTTSGNSHS